MKFHKEDVTGIIKLVTSDKTEQEKIMAALLEAVPEKGKHFTVEEELAEISAALDRLNLSEREVKLLADALDRLYEKGMAHGAFLHKNHAKRPRRYTQNMIRNFVKLWADDEDQQSRLAYVLEDALPEEEPADGYEVVATMIDCMKDDFQRADPQNTDPDARVNIIRDHADALFIDGMVYGAYLAMTKK